MLAALGVGSLAELVDRAVPDAIRDHAPLDLPVPLGEAEALARLRELADRNQVFTSLIGQGYSGTITPPVIQRNVLENPAWYTAYTPYQPEISQGRLEALLNFQTMVSDLTAHGPRQRVAARRGHRRGRGDDHAATGSTRKGGDTFFVDAECHPQTIDVVRTRAEPARHRRGGRRARTPTSRSTGVFGVLLQYPGTTGVVRDDRALVDELHAQRHAGRRRRRPARARAARPAGGVGRRRRRRVRRSASACRWATAARTPRSSPRATSTSATCPAAWSACRSTPRAGPRLRLALQTREQHIRREKATSNICTAQVLLANIAGMYAVYHGPDGLRAIAERVHDRTRELATGCGPPASRCTTVRSSTRSRVRRARRRRRCWHSARDAGINLRKIDDATRRHRARRDHHARDRRARRARSLGTPTSPSRSRVTLEHPWSSCAHVRHPHPPGVPHLPLRVADAALPAPARRPRPRARPHDDPARVVHDEAQRHRRDDADHLAGVREHAPVRAGRPGRGLRRAVRRPRARAVRDHRLRRGVAAAQRRFAGRARGPARHPRLPRAARARRRARCASSRSRRTAPTPPAR